MEYRTFGGTGIQVSRQCLGAMMFGRMGNPDHAQCVQMTHAALDAGINFIDTADGYSAGESEQILAKALAGRRQNTVLATKCFFPMGRDPNEGGGSRRWILRAVEASLARLDTDWIDLLQLHRRDPRTDLEESLSALTDLVRQGKIRAFGMSATPAETIVEAQWVAERRALHRVRGEQCIYSIFNRGAERAVFGAGQRYGLGVLTYGPLCGGWLSGKYRRGAELPGGSRATGPLSRGRWDAARAEVQRKYDLLDALGTLAREAGLPLSHLALGFAAEHPAVSSVIIGPRTPAQLADNLAAADVRLSPEILDRIDALVAPGTDVDPRDTISLNPALEDRAQRRRATPR
jgi:aryl-alcohol dehydrogenase-like predicted oxidoreductase